MCLICSCEVTCPSLMAAEVVFLQIVLSPYVGLRVRRSIWSVIVGSCEVFEKGHGGINSGALFGFFRAWNSVLIGWSLIFRCRPER